LVELTETLVNQSKVQFTYNYLLHRNESFVSVSLYCFFAGSKALRMKKWMKIVLTLFVIGMITALAGYIFVYNKPHPKYAQLQTDFTLQAGELYRAFVLDAKAASDEYNGKMLDIEGELTVIEASDTTSIAYFVLEEGVFGHQGVRISMMPEFGKRLTDTLIGNKIHIKGLCAGFNDTDVILEHGSL